jgi:prepilin-type N-terminal cleavage/methylation domain-containing protein
MKFKKSGFTLIELIVGIAIAGVVIMGMLAATMSYLKILEFVSGNTGDDKFNRENVTRKFLTSEISALLNGLDKLSGDTVTFRKLNGELSVYGGEEAYLYWESREENPFVVEDKGGITQLWLKCEARLGGDGAVVPGKLLLYYRSLEPGISPSYAGLAGDPTDFIVLLEECYGINFCYTNVKNGVIDVLGRPLFSNGRDPDLPEFIQILLPP